MSLFTDPSVQVIITDPDTKKEWKMTYPEAPYITGASANYERGHVSAFTFSIDVPYDKGIKMLDTPSRFKQGNIVKLRIGYPTQGSEGWTPWIGGFISATGVNLTVDANGVAGEVAMQGLGESYGYNIEESLLKSIGWNITKLAEACAKGMGVGLYMTTAAKEAFLKYLPIGEGLTRADDGEPFPSYLLGMSYLEIIKRICREKNLDFLIAPYEGDDYGRTIHIGSKADFATGIIKNKTEKTYQVRGGFDEENQVYPCFSWSPEGSNMGQWLASAPDPSAHGKQGTYVDKETGNVAIIIVKPKESDVKLHGQLAKSDPREEEAEGLKNDESRDAKSAVSHVGIAVNKGGEAKAKTQLEASQQDGNPAQRGVITTIGLPNERPGSKCYLRGAGAINDGPYTIDKLTHTYAPGSWEMSLTVHREGVVEKTGDQEESAGGQLEDK